MPFPFTLSSIARITMDSNQQPSPNPVGPTQELFKPWKVIGVSAFLASDNDFMIFRRFGALIARLLLRLQDEIVVLEKCLQELETVGARPEAPDIHHGSFRREALPERTQTLDEIYSRIREYSKRTQSSIAVLTAHACRRTPDPKL